MPRSLAVPLVFLAVAFLVPTAPALAQAAGGSDALATYNAEKKDEFAAALLEMAIPVLGHAYAGDARAGLRPLALSVGGFAAFIAGTTVGCRQEALGICLQEGNDALLWGGLLAYLGGRVWGVVSAMDLTRQVNQDLRERLRLAVVPEPGGVSAVFSITVGP